MSTSMNKIACDTFLSICIQNTILPSKTRFGEFSTWVFQFLVGLLVFYLPFLSIGGFVFTKGQRLGRHISYFLGQRGCTRSSQHVGGPVMLHKVCTAVCSDTCMVYRSDRPVVPRHMAVSRQHLRCCTYSCNYSLSMCK